MTEIANPLAGLATSGTSAELEYRVVAAMMRVAAKVFAEETEAIGSYRGALVLSNKDIEKLVKADAGLKVSAQSVRDAVVRLADRNLLGSIDAGGRLYYLQAILDFVENAFDATGRVNASVIEDPFENWPAQAEELDKIILQLMLACMSSKGCALKKRKGALEFGKGDIVDLVKTRAVHKDTAPARIQSALDSLRGSSRLRRRKKGRGYLYTLQVLSNYLEEQWKPFFDGDQGSAPYIGT